MLRGLGVGRKTYNKEVVDQVKKDAEIEETKEEKRYDIFTNFKHYGMVFPEILS